MMRPYFDSLEVSGLAVRRDAGTSTQVQCPRSRLGDRCTFFVFGRTEESPGSIGQGDG